MLMAIQNVSWLQSPEIIFSAFESFLATPFVALEMRPSSYVHIKALGH